MSKFRNYFSETITEMTQNVTWPTWKELQSNALIVVVASVIFALLVFAMDNIFGITGTANSTWKGIVGFIYSFF
ncbi:preprotein translocase subunit SecE [Fluviicola sp.]|jgi:preprotein translocase subunit SecE|uniref:preprotein translocase subunit SecE n=1 Tax=Fluviicola sp. TaxID=1917219 RepID=UPI00282EA0C0|nr:preprotein translocase subunit SecE [Fluviicola sp.]MDR0802377.1 preprotein translocase subunit SecE [Fluviicola sp.]